MEIDNHWDPKSYVSPWGSIIAGIEFGGGLPALYMGYNIDRKRHPEARTSCPASFFSQTSRPASTALDTHPPASRFAPAYHAPSVTGHLVPMYKGRIAVEWAFSAEGLEAYRYWYQAFAATEIARQSRLIEDECAGDCNDGRSNASLTRN